MTARDEPNATANGAVEEVEVRGHIVDSLLLPKILDRILQMGGSFEIRECVIGSRRVRPELRPDRHSSRGFGEPGRGDRRRPRRARGLAGSMRRMRGSFQPISPGRFPTTSTRPPISAPRSASAASGLMSLDQEMDCGIVIDISAKTARCVRDDRRHARDAGRSSDMRAFA